MTQRKYILAVHAMLITGAAVALLFRATLGFAALTMASAALNIFQLHHQLFLPVRWGKGPTRKMDWFNFIFLLICFVVLPLVAFVRYRSGTPHLLSDPYLVGTWWIICLFGIRHFWRKDDPESKPA